MAKGKDISMRQLRYFMAAAEAGQLSQAAVKVHVSQSAITAAVLQLEQTLGVRLFDRLPYGVTLTAEGHRQNGVSGGQQWWVAYRTRLR